MVKKNALDVLKVPVHSEVLKKTHIRKLQDAGTISAGLVTLTLPKEPELPAAVVVRESITGLSSFNPLKGLIVHKSVSKTASARVKLRVVHTQIVTPQGDQIPPCSTCKTSACCSAFVVGITALEYESGLYAPYAVEITPEIVQQLRGRLLRSGITGGPHLYLGGEAHYYLEGRVGEPCPLLGTDGACSVYEDRPVVCRSYTCMDDTRITQEIRDGSEDPK